jgi:hypothetical protein
VCCSQIFFLLDVVGAVQQLFMMPEFAAARGTARTPGKAGTWYASPHYKRLNEATGGLLDMLVNSAWELGADGVQLTLSRKNSTLVFILRCPQRNKWCQVVRMTLGTLMVHLVHHGDAVSTVCVCVCVCVGGGGA